MFSIGYLFAALAAASLSHAIAASLFRFPMTPLTRTQPSISRRQNQWQTGQGLASWTTFMFTAQLCTQQDFRGTCQNWSFSTNTCLEVPEAYNDNIGSVTLLYANANCILYADPFCSGHSYEMDGTQESNVVSNGGFGGYGSGDGVTGIRCWADYGSVPGQTGLSHNAYYCLGQNYGGDCTYQLVRDTECAEIPQPYNGNIASFVAPPDAGCYLFSGYFCTGSVVLAEGDGIPIVAQGAAVAFTCLYIG